MKRIYTILALVCFTATSMFAQLIINEVLYDPSNSGLLGDANGDGTYSQTQDEFIEFFNNSIPYSHHLLFVYNKGGNHYVNAMFVTIFFIFSSLFDIIHRTNQLKFLNCIIK